MTSIGDLSLDFSMDLSPLDVQVQEIESYRVKPIEVQFVANPNRFKQQIQALGEGTIPVNVVPDFGDFQRQVEQYISSTRFAAIAIPINLQVDSTQLDQQLQALRDRGGFDLAVRLKLDDASIAGQIGEIQSRIQERFQGTKLHLKTTVDDSSLTKLNQHLDLKETHYKRVQKLMSSNPLTPSIDTSAIEAALGKLDALSEKLAAIENQAANVNVRVTADTSDFEAQIRRLQSTKVKLRSEFAGDEKQSNKSLAEDFAKEIGKAIKKSNSKGLFGGLFDGIGSIISAPFKVVGATLSNVFTGVGLGIGQKLSDEIGKGLFEGIEDELSPLIGSFELVGRKAGQALTKELLEALGADAAEIQRIFKDLIGEDDILVQSGTKQSRRKKQSRSDRVEATRFYEQEEQEIGAEGVRDLAKQKVKLFYEQPAGLNDVEKALNIKVAGQVDKLDQQRIKKLDVKKISKQIEQITKQLELEDQNLLAIKTDIALQEQAIAESQSLIANLQKTAPNSPELQEAKAELRQQKSNLFDTKQQEQSAGNFRDRLVVKREELQEQSSPLTKQIESTSGRVKTASSKLTGLRGTLTRQEKEVTEAQTAFSAIKQIDPKSAEFDPAKLEQAKQDLAEKKANLALTQKKVQNISSNILQYSNKLDQLVGALDVIKETVNQVFQPQFERLDQAREKLRAQQTRFARKNQIIVAPQVLGTIRSPEVIDSAIAESQAKIAEKEEKRSAIGAAFNQGQKQIEEARRLAREARDEDSVKAKIVSNLTRGLKIPRTTPEQVKSAIQPGTLPNSKDDRVAPLVDEKRISRLNEIAINLEENVQFDRYRTYRQLTKDIAKEEALIQSLLAQKSTTPAKRSQAANLQKDLAQTLDLQKRLEAGLEKAIAAKNEDDAEKIRGFQEQAKKREGQLRDRLALLDVDSSSSASSSSAPIPTPAPASTASAAPAKPKEAQKQPALYVEAVQQIAQRVTGKPLAPEQIPQLVSKDLQGRGDGAYSRVTNKTLIDQRFASTFDSPITKDLLPQLRRAFDVVIHETVHGIQTEFGKNDPYETGANPVRGLGFDNPTAEELRVLGPEIEQSVAFGDKLYPTQSNVTRELETQAYTAHYRSRGIGEDLIKKKAIAQFQGSQGVGGDKLLGSVASLMLDLNKVVKDAQAAGIEAGEGEQAIRQRILGIRDDIAPLLTQSQNLDLLPVEEILDLQETFAKQTSNLTPVAQDIIQLRAQIEAKAAQAGKTLGQPAAAAAAKKSVAAANFTNAAGLAGGKLQVGLQEAEIQVNNIFEEMKRTAIALGIDIDEDISQAQARIKEANDSLAPLFDKAAQIQLLPDEEIEAFQQHLLNETQRVLDLIAQQPDITGDIIERKVNGGDSGGNGGGSIATQEPPEPTADRKELQDLLRQFGVKKLRPLAQGFGIETEGLKKKQLIEQLTTKVDPSVLQPKVFELTRAKAQQQVTRQGQFEAIAEGTGSVARKLLQAGQSISNVLAPFTGAASGAVKALGAVAKGGYKLAEASESLVLDILPFGRTAKSIGQQFVLPAATFAAASHLPGGHLAAEGLTNLAQGAISPFVHGAAGSAIDATSGFVSHAVPNVFGLQSHITQAFTGGFNAIADVATSVGGQVGAAVFGGKTIHAIAGRGLNAAGEGISNALAPADENKFLPPAKVEIPEAEVVEAKPLPLPELKVESKGELVPVEVAPAAPLAKAKTVTEVVKSAGETVGRTVKAAGDTTKAIASKTKQATDAVTNAGQQVVNLVRKINPEEALAEAEKLAANFRDAYKGLQDTLKAQEKALRKGDFSAIKKLEEKAQFLASNVVELADKAQQDITELVSNLGDAASSTTKLGQQLNNRKSQISKAKNKAERVQRVGQVTDTSGVIDVAASSSPAEDEGSLAVFGSLNTILEQQKKNLLELATKQLSDKSFINDQIVNAGGLIGGQIGSQFGVVGELGGDILGSLATRQALALGQAGKQAFDTVKDTDSFKRAGEFQKLVILIQQLKKELRSPEIQKALGGELTGDITGFVVGNIAGKLGTAGLQSLAGTVPGAGVLAAIPGKGALAAKLGVKPLVDARERFAANNSSSGEEEGSLAVFGSLNTILEKQRQRLAKLSGLTGKGFSEAEIQAKLREIDEEIDQQVTQRVADRIDLIETRIALDDQTSVGVSESANITQRRINKQKQIKLSPEQQQQFAALEIETERDINEDLTPESQINAARFDAAAERLNNRYNNTFERGAKVDPSTAKNETLERVKDVVGKGTEEYASAARKGLSQLGIDLTKLPGIAEGAFSRFAQAPKALDGVLKGLLGNVGNLAKGFFAFQTLKIAAQYFAEFGKAGLVAALQFDKLKTAMNFAAGGPSRGADNLQFVQKTVDDLKIPLASAREGFVKLSAATRNSKAEGATTRDLFTGISQAATVLGLSAEESGGALLALTQIASKGCYDGETEVLTNAGWINWQDVHRFHWFATLDLDTGAVCYQPAIRLIQYRHTGEMLKISSDKVDLLVTPDHRLIVREPNSDRLQVIAAKDLQNKAYYYSLDFNQTEVLITPDCVTWISNYDADVYCAEVANTTLFVRRNKKACWSGNSVQSEELRGQIGERIPGAFAIAARAMNVTEAQLNKMLELGQVTADEFLPKFARQLKSEFGDAAVSASNNAQSAMFDFQNTVLKSQESLGKFLQPAQVAGFRAAGEALKFVSDNGQLLNSALTLVAGVLVSRVLTALASLPIFTQAGALGFKGLATAGGAALGSMLAFGAQILIMNAIVEGAKGILDSFLPDELDQQFDAFGDNVTSNMKRIEEAALSAAGAVRGVKPDANPDADRPKEAKSRGFDFTLGTGGFLSKVFDTEVSFRGDDITKFRNRAQAEKLEKLRGKVSPEEFEKLKNSPEFQPQQTVGEVREENKIADVTRSTDDAIAIANQVMQPEGRKIAEKRIRQVGDIDAQLKGIQQQKQLEAAQSNPDKNKIAAFNQQEQELTNKRGEIAGQISAQRNAYTSNISQAKASLEAVDKDKDLTAEGASNVRGRFQKVISESEKAIAVLNQLEKAGEGPVDPIRKLAQTFEQLASKLEKTGKAAEIAFQGKLTNINAARLKGFSTDRNSAENAAVQTALAERDLQKTKVNDTQSVLNDQRKALQDPAVKAALQTIPVVDGKTLDENSTVVDLEAAKKQLGDKDKAKKDVIDRLIAFRGVEDKLRGDRAQLDQSEINLKTTTETAALKPIQDKAREEESKIQRGANKAQASIKQRVANRDITPEQEAIESANLQVKTTDLQIKEYNRQLDAYRFVKSQNKMSAEQFAQKELELNDRISDAEKQRTEQSAAAIEAVRRKQLADLELANQKADANLQLSKTVRITAIKEGVAGQNFGIDYQGELDFAASDRQTQRDTLAAETVGTEQEIALIKEKLRQNQDSKRKGLLTTKEAVTAELQLQQQLAQANQTRVDQEINAQRLLREEEKAQRELRLKAIQDDLDANKGAIDLKIAGFEKEKNGRDLINASLERSKELMQSQVDLQKALTDGAIAQTQIQLDAANAQLSSVSRLAAGGTSFPVRNVLERQTGAFGVGRGRDVIKKLSADEGQDPAARKKLESELRSLNVGISPADISQMQRLVGRLNQPGLTPGKRSQVEGQLQPLLEKINAPELAALDQKAALENKLSEQKLAALDAEQQATKALKQLDLERAKINAQNAATEARIAFLRAQQGSLEANAKVDSEIEGGDPAKIASAKRGAELAGQIEGFAQQQVVNADKNVAIQDELSDRALKALDISQKTAVEQFKGADALRKQNQELERANVLAKGLEETKGVNRPSVSARTYSPIAAGSAEAAEGVEGGAGTSKPTLKRTIGQALRFGTSAESQSNEANRIMAQAGQAGFDLMLKNLAKSGAIGKNQFLVQRLQAAGRTDILAEVSKAASPRKLGERGSSFTDSLRDANRDIVGRLDRLIGVSSGPRIQNLNVSAPKPVSSAGKIASDVSAGAVGAAGLG